MTLAVLGDYNEVPSAFAWTSPVAPEVLQRWLVRQEGPTIPEDLIALWREVGGGVLFESETILEPFASPLADDIDAENLRFHGRGMRSALLVFHVGLCVSAIDQATGEYVELDYDSLAELSRFGSLDSWYRSVVRPEYGSRYGLRRDDSP